MKLSLNKQPLSVLKLNNKPSLSSYPTLNRMPASCILRLPFTEPSGTPILQDRSQYGNHAAVTGSLVSVPGMSRALLFDGSNDYGVITNSASLQALTTKMSITAWVNAYAFGEDKFILDNTYFYDVAGFQLLYRAGSTCFDFTISDGSTWKSMSEIGGKIPATSPAINTRYHIAGVVTGASGLMKLFINGVQETEWDIDFTPVLSPDHDTRLGAERNAGHRWNGLFDEVRIYSKDLSDAEVRAVMLGIL